MNRSPQKSVSVCTPRLGSSPDGCPLWGHCEQLRVLSSLGRFYSYMKEVDLGIPFSIFHCVVWPSFLIFLWCLDPPVKLSWTYYRSLQYPNTRAKVIELTIIWDISSAKPFCTPFKDESTMWLTDKGISMLWPDLLWSQTAPLLLPLWTGRHVCNCNCICFYSQPKKTSNSYWKHRLHLFSTIIHCWSF